MNIRKISLLITAVIISLALTACVKTFKYEAYEGDDIPQTIRDDVHLIADEMIAGLRSNDNTVFSKYFYESGNDLDQDSIDYLYSEFEVKYADVELDTLVEYYSPSKVDNVTLPFILDSYTLHTGVDGKESYLLVYSGDQWSKDITISLFFIKTDDGWKVIHFYIGAYKAAGMNVEEWSQRAKSFYEEDKLVPAILSQQIVLELSQLAPILVHDDKKEFIEDMEMYQTEVNEKHSFPIDIQLEDGTLVQLVGAEPGFAGGEIMYIVNYVSSFGEIDGNETSIEAEAQLMHNEMIEMFNGFDEDISHIVYKAFEEMPAGSGTYYSYGTVINVE